MAAPNPTPAGGDITVPAPDLSGLPGPIGHAGGALGTLGTTLVFLLVVPVIAFGIGGWMVGAAGHNPVLVQRSKIAVGSAVFAVAALYVGVALANWLGGVVGGR